MRKTVLHIIVFSVCGVLDATAQITFQKVIESGEYLAYNSVVPTFDGGYIIGGTMMGDAFLTKIDSLGGVIWFKKFGGNEGDSGYRVAQTRDGGFMLAGTTMSYGKGYTDFFLLKTDSEGNEKWLRTFGSSGDEQNCSAIQTSDGGYALVGSIDKDKAGRLRDIYLVKTDMFGREQWVKEFGTTEEESAAYLQQTFDKGYIIGGFTDLKNPKRRTIMLIKTDSLGNKMWTKLYRGEGVRILSKVIQLKDGGYAICGDIHDKSKVPPRSDALVIRTDSLGSVIWEKYFGMDDIVDC